MKFKRGDLVWAWWIKGSMPDTGMAIVTEEENHEAHIKIWVPKTNDSVLVHSNAVTSARSAPRQEK
jgi:hypothetical protein